MVIHIEPIFCGIPTLADDVTLISNDPHELLTMLDIQSHHSNKLRYQINEQKSVILVFNDDDSNTWYLRILDISVPGHFGTDLDISVLGTGQFGTWSWMRPYSVHRG